VSHVFILAFVLFTLHPAGKPTSAENQQQEASMESLIRQATFVFVGTVVRTNATTMSEIPASDATAVVRVDEIVEAPGAPPDLKGQVITVKLSAAGSVKEGQQATFFTKGWLLGESLAVIELGHTATSAQVREQVQTTRQKAADEALKEEITSAEAVVAGTVASVKPSSIRHIGSEHDPDFYEAEITVDSVLKGKVTGHAVVVLFPNSDDVMWQSAPKFKPRQQGIWLLHRNQTNVPGVKDQYTALKPLDFQPPGELERIRSLSKAAK
jgi:hypothetical protein